jgi:plastocyanin
MKKLLILICSAFSLSAAASDFRVLQLNKTFVEDMSDAAASGLAADSNAVKTKKVEVIKVKAGDKIVFANRDIGAHNINGTAGSETIFDFGLQPPGQPNDRSFDFKKKGEFEVRCAIHPKMKLKVVVD